MPTKRYQLWQSTGYGNYGFDEFDTVEELQAFITSGQAMSRFFITELVHWTLNLIHKGVYYSDEE